MTNYPDDVANGVNTNPEHQNSPFNDGDFTVDISLDFGEVSCDALATYTVDPLGKIEVSECKICLDGVVCASIDSEYLHQVAAQMQAMKEDSELDAELNRRDY
jgi:hypothetical protein